MNENLPELPAPRWSKPIEWWLTRLLLRGVIGAGRVLPSRSVAPLGRGLGRLCFRLMPRYKRVALSNLRQAFGEEWDEARIERTALQSMEHLGVTLVEFFLRQPHLSMEA